MAAAAITGGNPFRTMMLTWRYTLPAFLVPFDFVLSPHGEALLLEVPAGDGLLAVAVSAWRWRSTCWPCGAAAWESWVGELPPPAAVGTQRRDDDTAGADPDVEQWQETAGWQAARSDGWPGVVTGRWRGPHVRSGPSGILFE